MDDSRFVCVYFQGSAATGRFALQWREPGRATVSVTLPSPAPATPYEEVLPVNASTGRALQAELARLEPSSEEAPAEFSLRLQRPTGAVLLRWRLDSESPALGRTRQAVERIAHLPYVVAKAYLARGRESLGSADARRAAEAFGAGLAALGSTYADSGTVDDTGMKKVLADSLLGQGRIEQAATVYERVLESRIAIFASKNLARSSEDR